MRLKNNIYYSKKYKKIPYEYVTILSVLNVYYDGISYAEIASLTIASKCYYLSVPLLPFADHQQMTPSWKERVQADNDLRRQR